MIRPFEPADGEAVAALLDEDFVAHVLTGPGVRHWLTNQPARAHARSWVAVAGKDVIGWSRARLQWATSAEGVAELWAFVRPPSRRRGVGAELYDVGRQHLASVGGRSLESWSSDEEGGRFLAARRFRAVRALHVLRLDLLGANLSGFAELRAEKEAQGYSLVPFAAVAHRAKEFHALDAAANADVP